VILQDVMVGSGRQVDGIVSEYLPCPGYDKGVLSLSTVSTLLMASAHLVLDFVVTCSLSFVKLRGNLDLPTEPLGS
jgi:hypothetical protein